MTVTNQIKEIKGIQATEIRDTVLLNGEVKEDTFDWYAQDDRGNVWYLGEDTKEYENGQVSSTAGSWLTGVKGAVPGIIMLGAPRPGDLYRQEFLRGEAEDMGAVMSLAEPAYSPFAFLSKALMTADFNVLGNLLEYKFYLRHVGHVRTLKVEDGAVSKLNSVSHARSQIVLDRGCGKSGGTPFVGTIRLRNGEKNLRQFAKVTSAQAEAAVRAVVANADITKTELEAENGFLVYTVTLNNEQEAIVDAGDGFVLALTPVEDVE